MPGIDARTPLDATRSALLSGTRFRVERIASTGSTNADLLRDTADGAADGAVLVADHQTAGRGRRGRTWEASPGASLLMSVLLRPAIEPERAAVLTAAVGLAARDACREVAKVTPGLKWPNDLVATTPGGERKLGGILAESRVQAGRTEAVVVGLGLNLTWGGSRPEGLDSIAVALDELADGGGVVDRMDVLVALLRHLELRLEAVEEGDDTSVWTAWTEASATLGRRVRVETGAEEIIGDAVEITDLGRLVLLVEGGTRREVDVGDVVHLRPVS